MFQNSYIYLFIIFIFSSTLFSTDLDDIKKNGELRHLGVPYASFITGSGDGLSVEIMQGFAKHLNVKYTYVPTKWPSIFGDLTGRNAENSIDGVKFLDIVPIKGDLIANGLTILNWRKEVVNYSNPIFPSTVWLIARADSNINPIKPTGNIFEDIKLTKSKMSERTVLAVENSCIDPRLYNLKATKAIIQLQAMDIKLNELVPYIMNNRAETTLLDVPDALIALEKWPGSIKVIGPISGKQEMAVAFRKDSPMLLKEFNNYLKEIKSNGVYVKLVQKYYPSVFYYFEDFFKNE